MNASFSNSYNLIIVFHFFCVSCFSLYPQETKDTLVILENIIRGLSLHSESFSASPFTKYLWSHCTVKQVWCLWNSILWSGYQGGTVETNVLDSFLQINCIYRLTVTLSLGTTAYMSHDSGWNSRKENQFATRNQIKVFATRSTPTASAPRVPSSEQGSNRKICISSLTIKGRRGGAGGWEMLRVMQEAELSGLCLQAMDRNFLFLFVS